MNTTQTANKQNAEKTFRELRKKQNKKQSFIIMLPVKNDLNQPKMV